MDIHEADSNHLIQAHSSAMSVVETHPDWVRIDCELDGAMRSIQDIHRDILAQLYI